jgi:hypothetical protein
MKPAGDEGVEDAVSSVSLTTGGLEGLQNQLKNGTKVLMYRK